jgi:hypothetical protein
MRARPTNSATRHHCVPTLSGCACARERTILPKIPDLSPQIIFGTCIGGETLTKFVEESQACIRPRDRALPSDDHG